MRSATVAPPDVSGARFVDASSQRIAFSRKRESGKVCDEAGCVLQATQVKDQRLILRAADHRNGKAPQRCRKSCQSPARCTRVRGLDRKAGARDSLGWESTRTNLAHA